MYIIEIANEAGGNFYYQKLEVRRKHPQGPPGGSLCQKEEHRKNYPTIRTVANSCNQHC